MSTIVEEKMQGFIIKRDELLENFAQVEPTSDNFKIALVKISDLIMYHVKDIMDELSDTVEKKKELEEKLEWLYKNNWKVEQKINKQKFIKQKRVFKPSGFEKLIEKHSSDEKYQKGEWRENGWKDWEMTEDTWHTNAKSYEQGLHLVVHHTRPNKDRRSFNNGFTIIKDPRFMNDKKGHWSWRIELISSFDKSRKTRGYYVKQNEFGRKEWYAQYYKRMSNKGMVLENYQAILEENKAGLWKKHLLRIQRDQNWIKSILLRFKLSKEQWKEVTETGSFEGVEIGRKCGRDWKKYGQLAEEVIGTADEEGVFNIPEKILENWRLANRLIENRINENSTNKKQSTNKKDINFNQN